MKLNFYVSSDEDVQRCKESFDLGVPITIGGADALTGRAKSYAGVVLAIEPALLEAPGERWRVVIDDRR